MDFWKDSSTGVKVLLVIGAIIIVGLIAAIMFSLSDSNGSGDTGDAGAPEVVVPTFTPAGEAVQLPSGPAVIATSVVNVRLGPDTAYPEVGALQTGDTAPVIGRTEDGTWYAITFASEVGDQGWVAAEVVTTVNVENVPVVVAPPLPGQEPTPTAEAVLPQAPTAVIAASAVGETGIPVAFSAAQSTSATPLTKYAWSFGDGTVADAVVVEKTYDAPGQYVVNLVVVDSDGQEGVAQQQITINEALAPSTPESGGPIEVPDSFILVTVDGTPTSVGIVGGIPTFDAGVGQIVKLDATPALELYPTLAVVWDMGDGSPVIPGISAEHQYTAPAVYQIVISAEDGLQSVKKLWQVNVAE